MGVCAYCGNDRPLTKEHLYPRWLYSAATDHDIQILRKASKVVPAQLQIKDVCAGCNAGPLSMLDSYVKSLYVESLSKFVRPGETRELEYKYDLLARWLLKMCFNVARASGAPDEAVLRSTVPFILTGTPRPASLQVIARLIIPTRLTPEQLAKADATSLWEGMVPPNYDRVSRVDPSALNRELVSMWRVQLHAFQFHVLISAQGASAAETATSGGGVAFAIEEGTTLDPLATKVTIPASSIDTLHDLADNLRAFAAIYKAHGFPGIDKD